MFQLLREMSVSKLSAAILVGFFHYFQLMGVVSFRLIQGENGNIVCNQNVLKWTGFIIRLLALCGFIYHFGSIILSAQYHVIQALHGIRVLLSIPSTIIIMGYQHFRSQQMIKLVNRFLRLFRQVRSLQKSKSSGFGGRREFVLILLKVACFVHETTYQFFMAPSEYTVEFFMEWLCNTYVISGTNIFQHIYCLVFLSIGALYSEVNKYALTELAAQLEALNPPISRRKRRKVRCQLENCLALYREIYAVNTAFQEFFELPIVLALTNKILMLMLFGYNLMISPIVNTFHLWILLGKHALDLHLLTLSVQGAANQFKVIRRLNLEVYAVSDLPEFHTMLEVFFTHLNLYQFRVRVWGLCDVSNEFFIIFISALVTWLVFIAQYKMQLKNV